MADEKPMPPSGAQGRMVYKDADAKVVHGDAAIAAALKDGFVLEPPLEHWYPHAVEAPKPHHAHASHSDVHSEPEPVAVPKVRKPRTKKAKAADGE